MKDILAYIITCKGREPLLERTLASFAASDWGTKPNVVMQPDSEPPSWNAAVANSKRAIERAIVDHVDYMLFCEDDVIVNKNIRHNVVNWRPFFDGLVEYATFYLPSKLSGKVAWKNANDRDAYRIAHPAKDWPHDGLWGAQCLLMSHWLLQRIVENWDDYRLGGKYGIGGAADEVFVKVAAAFNTPQWVHVPSLAQHQEREDVGPEVEPTRYLRQLTFHHEAADFNAEWKSVERPNIGAYLITCQGREEVLDRTLTSFERSDWGAEPKVIRNLPHEEPGWKSTAINSRRAMQAAFDDGVDWMLFVEDDIFVNKHLRWNLLNWKPLRDNKCDFASLYIPSQISNPRGKVVEDDNYWLPRPMSGKYPFDGLWGSQAYLFSRRFLWRLLQDWWAFRGGQDGRTISIMGSQGFACYYHLPCLVQHQPRAPTVFASPPHQAPDYDEHWKAKPLADHLEGVTCLSYQQ